MSKKLVLVKDKVNQKGGASRYRIVTPGSIVGSVPVIPTIRDSTLLTPGAKVHGSFVPPIMPVGITPGFSWSLKHKDNIPLSKDMNNVAGIILYRRSPRSNIDYVVLVREKGVRASPPEGGYWKLPLGSLTKHELGSGYEDMKTIFKKQANYDLPLTYFRQEDFKNTRVYYGRVTRYLGLNDINKWYASGTSTETTDIKVISVPSLKESIEKNQQNLTNETINILKHFISKNWI